MPITNNHNKLVHEYGKTDRPKYHVLMEDDGIPRAYIDFKTLKNVHILENLAPAI